MQSGLTLISTFIAIGDQIDSLWQFFVSVHLAIIASLYGIERLNNLRTIETILFGFGYIIFSLINMRAKQQAYGLLINIENEINSSSSGLSIYPFLSEYFSNSSYDDRLLILWIVHAFAGISIVIILLFRHPSRRVEK